MCMVAWQHMRIPRVALLLVVCPQAWVCRADIHRIKSPADVRPLDPAYTGEHWASVNFPPVPVFSMDTHDPLTQDVFISGAVHEGRQPWDVFIWDRIVQLTPAHPSGLVFVDVGANLGFFSLAAASLGYRVIAFEPMTRNLWKLARSVSRNAFQQRVTLYQNAVTSSDGQLVSLRETDVLNQGNGQLVNLESNHTLPQQGGVYGIDFVDTVTLSSVMLFAPITSQDAYIVKIDVEGFEAAVLAGGRGWICSSSVSHVILEFSEATRTNLVSPATRMFAFMQNAGYSLYDVSIHSSDTIDYPPLIAGDFRQLPPNLLFSRPRGRRHCDTSIF